jgi:DNA polymerase/3'-5' exonuclease PolX
MKVQLALEKAIPIAEDLREGLVKTQLFSRVAIAGSIRRKKPLVGDIELVGERAVGQEFMFEDRVRQELEALRVSRGDPGVRKDGRPFKAPWGERYFKGKHYMPGLQAHIQVDFFVVFPPADWGVVYLIRTGCAEFSQAFVTRLHRWGLHTDGGHLVTDKNGVEVPCKDEETFFRWNRMEFVPAEHREVGDPVGMTAFKGET